MLRIHSGNGTHEEMDRRAISCFDQALGDVGLGAEERLRQVLHDLKPSTQTAHAA